MPYIHHTTARARRQGPAPAEDSSETFRLSRSFLTAISPHGQAIKSMSGFKLADHAARTECIVLGNTGPAPAYQVCRSKFVVGLTAKVGCVRANGITLARAPAAPELYNPKPSRDITPANLPISFLMR